MKFLIHVLLFTRLFVPIDIHRLNEDISNRSIQNKGATRLKPTLSISKQTKYVSCWNKRNRLTGSRLVRTPILASSDGSRRAYIEVEATAFQPKDEATYIGNLCENTSRLFFAGGAEADFKLVFSQSDENFSDGNSLGLVDWSSDGTRLLMERTRWKYESEGDYTDFVVFDALSGRLIQPDLEVAIAARYGKDCGTENSTSGFTEDGKIVVALAPLTDEIALADGAQSCVKRKAFLAVNLNGPIATTDPIDADFRPVRHSKFLAFAPKR